MLPENSTKYDVQRTCRSCLCDSNEMVSLQRPLKGITEYNFNLIAQQTIGEAMMNCVNIQYEFDDGLPQNVCNQCVSELRVAFVYRKRCEESDAKLRGFFQQYLSSTELNVAQKTEFHVEGINSDHPLEEHWFEDGSQQNNISENDDDWPMSDNDSADNAVEDKSTTNNDKATVSDDDEDEDLRIVARAQCIDGRWLCEICNKSLADRKTLKHHVRLHLGKKLKRCSVCDQGFAKQSHLNKHMLRHGPKTYRCHDCDKVFETKEARRQHRTENHKNKGVESKKTEVDDTDGLKISTEAELDELVNAAKIKNRKFECFVCERSFTEKLTLRLHLVTHNTIRLKRCEICGEGFRMIDQFNDHMAWHKNAASSEPTEETSDAALTVKSEVKIDTVEESMDVEDSAKAMASKAEIIDGRFKCEICERTLIDRKSLVLHIRLHTGKNLHRCTYCQRGFSKRSHMNRHVKLHEKKLNTEGGVSAVATRAHKKSSIKSSAFEMLGKPNAEKRCLCKICDASFDRIMKLQKHIRSHGTTNPLLQKRINGNQNLCELYQITNKSGWEMTLSDSETDANDSADDDIGLSASKELKRIHTCGSCNRSYDRRYKLVAHMDVDHAANKFVDFERFQCTNCNQVYPNEKTLEKHRRDQCGNSLKKFICKKCGVRFQWSSSMEIHTSQAHPRKKFSCDNCDREYYRCQDLERHKKTHDKLNEFKFTCEYCSKPFKQNCDYIRHKATHNADEKRFTCDICQRKFSRKDNLRTHMRIHNPNSIQNDASDGYLCIYCGKSFNGSSNLTVHIRRHTGERPFKCDLCDKTFPRNSDMLCHRRTHTGEKPWVCSVCGYAFSRSNKLTRHMRTHTGEKPHKCTHCGRGFTQSNDLTLHIRRHTGEKPYGCGICGARFIQNTMLNQHRRALGHFEEESTEPKLPPNSVNNIKRFCSEKNGRASARTSGQSTFPTPKLSVSPALI